jgi:hypothetical protein
MAAAGALLAACAAALRAAPAVMRVDPRALRPPLSYTDSFKPAAAHAPITLDPIGYVES